MQNFKKIIGIDIDKKALNKLKQMNIPFTEHFADRLKKEDYENN